MQRNTLLISIALMLAVIAAACGNTESKPAQAPTAIPIETLIPTVITQSDVEGPDTDTAAAAAALARLADPAVIECLTEQLGESFDPESGGLGQNLFGLLGSEDFTAALETCGVDISGGLGSAFGEFSDRFSRGGFGGDGAFSPEALECLTEKLGEDFADGFGEFGSRGDASGDHEGESQLGGGLRGGDFGEEIEATLEECGIDLGDSAFGGFSGGLRGFGDRDGDRGGRFGGFLGDGSIQECLNELLGPDALAQPGSGGGDGPSAEFREALQECSGGGDLPGGFGEFDGFGDHDDEATLDSDPTEESTATSTPIPVTDLSIEQLTCLAGELEAADLANVVIATSLGDLSELTDDVLVVLEACGFES